MQKLMHYQRNLQFLEQEQDNLDRTLGLLERDLEGLYAGQSGATGAGAAQPVDLEREAMYRMAERVQDELAALQAASDDVMARARISDRTPHSVRARPISMLQWRSYSPSPRSRTGRCTILDAQRAP